LKNLANILTGITTQKVIGNSNISIDSIIFDSRKATKNTVFVAQKGVSFDGHIFIEKAIQLGATVIVCEDLPTDTKEEIAYIKVTDSNVALAEMASNFYGNPSSKMQLIGVTGTNGKTTIASLLYQLFKKAGYKTGLLSTVKVMVDDVEFKATHTTPDSIRINKHLANMVAAGVTHCFMEVSSHGIDQKRTAGLDFNGGVFTNLTHDHLDYHNTFSEYRDVKKIFFDNLPKSAFALVNIDDKNGEFMLQNTKATHKTYALKTLADYKAKILEKSFSGTLISVDGMEVWTKLIGTFNIYNLLAIVGTANLLGLDKLEILRIVSELESVSGRFQYVKSNNDITAIIDYAHTPDALKNVLETINDIKNSNQNLIGITGCGGDRDKTKRPKMAHIISELSNQAILTSDNPRTEDAQVILEEMETGIISENQHKTLTILDRKQAIKTACKLAQSGDIILIAGKGHETYQEVNGVRHHFDDLEEVTQFFNQLNHN